MVCLYMCKVCVECMVYMTLRVCECVWCVCMCGVCVCVVGVGRVASHGGDSVAVGSRLLAKIHSSLLASCFPGFIWAGEDSEFLLGTNPAGRAGC